MQLAEIEFSARLALDRCCHASGIAPDEAVAAVVQAGDQVLVRIAFVDDGRGDERLIALGRGGWGQRASTEVERAVADRAMRTGRRTAPHAAWSTHPVAASLLASRGRALPMMRLSRIASTGRRPAEQSIAGGRNLRRVRASFNQGVLTIISAELTRDDGTEIGRLLFDGRAPFLHLLGAWPESTALSLRGRTAADLCNVLAADPRGAATRIERTTVFADQEPAFMRVTFADTLVPLRVGDPGGEPWRPTRSAGLVRGSFRRRR